LKIISGRLLIGFKTLRFIKGLPKAVKRRGAVSPATLAMLNRTPVAMPLTPAGKITFRIVLG
jgi:hypothetical protein